MTAKVFHMAMVDNALHLLALGYLTFHVTGQPDWFYYICNVLIICYMVTSLITILTYFLSNLPGADKPKQPPHNP